LSNKKPKDMNLAYGGQAIIEGVLMRSGEGYAFTVRKPDGSLYKEEQDYIALGKRIKILGKPFIRGISGFYENIILGTKVLNKSADIAFPEEVQSNKKSNQFTMILSFVFAFGIAMLLFVGAPYFITELFKLDHVQNPFLYNIVSGVIRMVFFFVYLLLISLLKDTKRLFGYHGAEHKTINAFERGFELTIEKVKTASRLHPRCGTSFIFIVFIITIIVFPFFNVYFNSQEWYLTLHKSLQKLVIIFSHIIIGMPFVASISYELLKLSAKHEKNPIVKFFVSPGLFFQLLTTREPEDGMIEIAIESLKMVVAKSKVETNGNEA